MLLWNSAGPEEAVTLHSSYKGKIYCVSAQRCWHLQREDNWHPWRRLLLQPSSVTHTHVPSSFSPGRHCADTEVAGVDARAHGGEGASSRKLSDTKKHLAVAIKCC